MIITYTENKKIGRILLFQDDTKILVSNKTAKELKLEKFSDVEIEEVLEYDHDRMRSIAATYTMDVLSQADKTQNELRKKLEGKSIPTDIIDALIDELTKKNLINDERYAENFLTSMLYQNKGVGYIRNKLKEKGVDRAIIDNVLAEIDKKAYQENLIDLIERFNKDLIKYPIKMRKDKITAKLLSKGYSLSEIYDNLDRIKDEDEDYDSFFIEKINKKLSSYVGRYEMIKVRQKLYSEFLPKGCDKDLIDRCIDEFDK